MILSNILTVITVIEGFHKPMILCKIGPKANLNSQFILAMHEGFDCDNENVGQKNGFLSTKVTNPVNEMMDFIYLYISALNRTSTQKSE